VSLFVWLLPFDLSGTGGPTGSYATAGIALWVSEAHKLPHHVKVETQLGEDTIYRPTNYLAVGRLRNRKWRQQFTPKTPCPPTSRHDIMLIITAARTSNLVRNF